MSGIGIAVGRWPFNPQQPTIVFIQGSRFVDLLGRFGTSERTALETILPVQQAASACSPAVTAGDLSAGDKFDVMTRLAEIDKPVRVLSGTNDRLAPPQYSAYPGEHIRGWRRIQVQEAGHLVPVEKPGEVNRVLQAFAAHLAEGL